MSNDSKYRVHQVAKDFGMTSKEIGDILASYVTAPKNHMQALSDDELNLVFDYITQNNQVEDLESLFADLQSAASQPVSGQPEPVSDQAAPEVVSAPEDTPTTSSIQQTAAVSPAEGAVSDAQPAPAAAAAAVAQPAVRQNVTPLQGQGQRPAPQGGQQFQQPSGQAQRQPSGQPQFGQNQQARPPQQGQPRPPVGGQPQTRQPFGQPQQGQQARPPQQGQQRPAGQQFNQQPRPAAGQPVQTPAGQPGQAPAGQTDAAAQAGPKVRVIDTRGGQVDLARYDERIDHLVPDRAQNMQHGKQKIKTKQDIRKPGVPFSQKRRAEEQEKMRRLQQEALKKHQLKVSIPDEIAVGELALRLKKTGAEVVKALMKNGVMASISQTIDYDTAALIALDFGAKVEHEVHVTIEERLFDVSEDTEDMLVPRDPVVVVMGHVDHGKTSILDVIRSANVASGEAGGITQHIGAYRVSLNDREITFLDTPGHEAFTSMRARGASVTDVAILVVAADDGIMPQTIEAINHAKAADVPIVVAINKMDKPGANPEKIMQQLTEHEMVPEEWGGETIVCPVSAKTREGLEHLLEMVLLTADMRELRANPARAARGTVIEAKLDKGRGPVATVLVQNGTLHHGEVIIAGKAVGRVRAMTDDKGRKVQTAGPSEPVEVIGLAEVPGAGDQFFAVADERMARELVEQRKQQEKDERTGLSMSKVSLDDLFARIQEGQLKDLNLIVRADVQGSAEALKASLEKLTNEEVRVRVIHCAVGAITESDILLASTSGAIVIGFNVRPEPSARDSAANAGVDMRLYSIIYDCIGEMEAAMKGMLTPKYHEVELGRAEVRQIFKVTGVGTVAGCHVLEGKITRSAKIRLVRDGIVVHNGELASLKRFKDDAKEVASGFDCGMGIEKFNDLKDKDIIEAYVIEEIKPV